MATWLLTVGQDVRTAHLRDLVKEAGYVFYDAIAGHEDTQLRLFAAVGSEHKPDHPELCAIAHICPSIKDVLH